MAPIMKLLWLNVMPMIKIDLYAGCRTPWEVEREAPDFVKLYKTWNNRTEKKKKKKKIKKKKKKKK